MTPEHTPWAQVARDTRRTPNEDAGWARLERFLADLDGADRPDRQARLLLDAVCDLTAADAAALVPLSADPVVLAGPRRPDQDHARRLVARLVKAGTPTDSQLAARQVNSAEVAAACRGLAGPLPSRVLLVRAGRSKPAWLAVFQFADRPFAPGALGAARLTVRALRSRQRSARYTADLSEALFGVVQGFAAAIDAKDPCTAGHSERVARMASRIGKQMGLPAGTVSDLYLAGLLHDIGKIGVPEAILTKPGRLTDAEYLQVQMHPAVGDRILAGIRQLGHVRPGVRSHHERIDGTGYPDRLAGDAIPLLGRVLAVADTCDAMLSARPYRPALDPQVVEAELARGRGTQWDAAAVDGFLGCRQEIYTIRQTGLGSPVHQAIIQAVEKTGGSFHDLILEPADPQSR